MKTVPMKRITIVGDNAVERQIVKEVHDLGATGYTYTVVHGEGARGTRPSHWEGPNAKIEVIATADVARRILEHVAQTYFEHYAVIAFLDDVEVLRGEKFTPNKPEET
jgi:nitrogen regulatory protein PII